MSLEHKSIARHFCSEPIQKICHVGVNTKLASLGAAIAPARDTLQIIFPSFFTHHWSTTIPLTGIDSAFVQARADHGIVDFIGICLVAALATRDWHRRLLKIFWRRTSCLKCAPPCDPAFLSSYRRVYVVWKTSEIHIPKIRKNKMLEWMNYQNELHFRNFHC